MDLLSLSILAVFLLLAGAVVTGVIGEHLPESVIRCSGEGRFATFSEDHATSDSEHGAVAATPSPSAV